MAARGGRLQSGFSAKSAEVFRSAKLAALDLRTRTSLFCGVLGLAIAVSILLRGRPNKPRLFFAALAFDIGLWYLAQWLYHSGRSDLWARWTAVLAVFLPQFALQLFEAIIPEPN